MRRLVGPMDTVALFAPLYVLTSIHVSAFVGVARP